MRPLDLLSWNVHGSPGAPGVRRRLAAIAAEVLREPQAPHRRPDLVLFQEVWFSWQYQALMDALRAHYEPVASPRAGFVQRPSGLLALRRRDSPWQVDDGGRERFDAGAPWFHWFEIDRLAGKGFQHFRASEGDARVLVANTHLQAAYPNDDHRREREQQLEELQAGLERLLRESPMPTLLVGDLNTHPGEPLFTRFVAGWTELTQALRLQCGCASHLHANDVPAGWIDYALARVPEPWQLEARVSLIANQGTDRPFSDHHGLRIHAQIGVAEPASALAWLLLANLARRQHRRGFLGAALAALAGGLAAGA